MLDGDCGKVMGAGARVGDEVILVMFVKSLLSPVITAPYLSLVEESKQVYKGMFSPAFRQKGEGREIAPPLSVVSQLISTQNSSHAKVTCLDVARSDPLHQLSCQVRAQQCLWNASLSFILQ